MLEIWVDSIETHKSFSKNIKEKNFQDYKSTEQH